MRFFSVSTTVFLAVCLVAVLFLGYGMVDNRWYHILAVEGGSMEPTLHWGDGVLITRPPAELEEKMIVTMNVDGQVVTHRVLQTDPLITQGDANESPDDWRPEQVQVVGAVRLRIPKLGWLLSRLDLSNLAEGGGAWFRDEDRVPGSLEASDFFATDSVTESVMEEAPLNPVESLPPAPMPGSMEPTMEPTTTTAPNETPAAAPPDALDEEQSTQSTTTSLPAADLAGEPMPPATPDDGLTPEPSDDVDIGALSDEVPE